MKSRLAWAAVWLLAAAGAAAATNGLSEAEREGRAVAGQILEQVPAENSALSGVLKIRARKAKPVEIPIKCQVIVTATNWQSVYEVRPGATNAVRLTVTHDGANPNRYELAESSGDDCCVLSVTNLTRRQTMVPFAGSDFWVADLGLEFFHWPAQRLIKKELRSSRSCYRLESTNPDPALGAYARVVSWIMIEPPHGIIHAEAYDAGGKLMKEFDPTDLEKVNGQYQVQKLEISNAKTGSRTWLEFNFDKK
jgi:hypothetical protein